MAALHAVDAKTRELSPEPVLALDGYDFRGSAVFDRDTRRLIGLHYETDVLRTLWLDPVMKATQEAVDAALPETINRIECQRCVGVSDRARHRVVGPAAAALLRLRPRLRRR